MSAQISFLPLLDIRSRNTDPVSSHRDEERMKRSGAIVGQCLVALEMVKQYPGRTSKELGKIGPLDRYQVARRLADLRDRDLVYRVEYEVGDCRWWVK